MRCEGKVVLVTGAQRGIGRAVALRFAQEGADVALNFLDDASAAEAAAAQITALGRRCFPIAADVSKPDEARRLVETSERDLGPIDVLVNNAGIFPRAPFLEVTEALWDSVLDTNLKGTFVCAQETSRRMVAARRPGVIINLASGAPYRGSQRATAYMASKLGIVGLTRGMAWELGGASGRAGATESLRSHGRARRHRRRDRVPGDRRGPSHRGPADPRER